MKSNSSHQSDCTFGIAFMGLFLYHQEMMIILTWIVAIILTSILIGLLFLLFSTLFYVLPMAKGAVYVPSKPEAIRSMIKLAKLKPGMKVADLGCGDGRVVIAFAVAGAEAHGYEVNPLLYLKARKAILKAGLQKSAFIHLKSYWDVDLSAYDVIAVYGITYIMKDLGQKLKRELIKGSRVVSNYFTFPNWTASRTVKGVHLYQK